MKFLFNKNTSSKIAGLKEFRPDVFKDIRGELWTSYNKKIFKDKVLKKLNFLQMSLSVK